jgi:hypothetical protein
MFFPTSRLAILGLPLVLGLGACALNPPALSVPTPGELTTRVRALLSSEDRSSADFRRARVELEEMGPEIDTVLVSLAYDPRARPVARANALLLLAERRVPAALSTLQWALFNSGDELVREAAVLGLYHFVNESAEAQHAIRTAVADPSPRVRLNALQSLEVHDINAIRSLLRTERHPLVREIAVQYLAISESRGAPLIADENGVLRTSGLESEPHLIFRAEVNESSGYARGELLLETPDGRILPLAYDVEVIRNVLPAFLSPDRSAAVIEAGRTILIRDFESREAIYLGPGLAPRPIPFSEAFVFVREDTVGRQRPPNGLELRYHVYRSEFGGTTPVRIGELQVTAQAGGDDASPVRWMTVGESPEGWELRIDGEPVFRSTHRPQIPPPVDGEDSAHGGASG